MDCWSPRESENNWRKTYKNVDMVLPFLGRSSDQSTGWMKEAPLTKIHVLYLDLMLNMTTDNGCRGRSEGHPVELEYYKEQFKRSLVRTSSDHCKLGLYMLKVHLLYHAVEDLKAFGTLSLLHDSSIGQYRVNIKHVYKPAFWKRDTYMHETVTIVGCRVNWKKTDLRMFSLKGER